MTPDRRTVALFDLHAAAHAYWHKSQTKELTWTHDSLVGRIEILSRDYPLCAVCSDLGRSFRYDVDPSYKIGRMPQDERAARERDNLQAEIRRAKQTLRDRGFVVLEAEGFEGEDIIATGTAWAFEQGLAVEIVGADKDLMCLVSDERGVSYRGIMSGERLTDAGVKRKYGVTPTQMTEWLALVGDTADGISGVKGIGEKGAAKLLEKYGTIADAMYRLDSFKGPAENATRKIVAQYEKAMSADLFTPAIRAGLLAARDDGSLDLAVRLITLRADAPIDCSGILANDTTEKGTNDESQGRNLLRRRDEESTDRGGDQGGSEGPAPHERRGESGGEGVRIGQGLDALEPAGRDVDPRLAAVLLSEAVDMHAGARRFDIGAKPVDRSDPVAPPARIQDPPVPERIRPMFAPAVRDDVKIKMTLQGPSKSGKTYTALGLFSLLLGGVSRGMTNKIAVIDSQFGQSKLYSQGRPFWFSISELQQFSPEDYIEAIRAAVDGGFEALVIDSLSHEWVGLDGVLEQADRVASNSNKFAAWNAVNPRHNALIKAILECPIHVIATMRVKEGYEIEDVEENGRTKKKVRKLGLVPVQRAGIGYEFDIEGSMNMSNVLTIDGSRCSSLTGKVFPKPGREFVEAVKGWLVGGERTERAVQPAANTNGTTGARAL